MIRRLRVVVLVVAIVGCIGGAGVQLSSRADRGDLIESWREKTPAPGVIVAVRPPDQEGTVIASGGLRKNEDEPLPVDSRFRVASVTKTLVAVIVAQLAEEGRLSFDQPAGKLLGGAGRPEGLDRLLDGVTVADLLGHTSGLPDTGRSPELVESLLTDPTRRWSPGEVLVLVAGRRPAFPPGTGFGYSNTNYLILGMIIEAVTGNPWWEEGRRRVLTPLGMSDSYIAGVEEPTGVVAPGYFDTDGDGFTEAIPHPWPALETSEGAAGALVSTARDLVHLIDGIVHGGLLSPRSLQAMTTPGGHSSRYSGYGLGMEILRPDLETSVWGHGGFLPGHRTIMWHAPGTDSTVVVLTNESRSRPDGLAELVLETATE